MEQGFSARPDCVLHTARRVSELGVLGFRREEWLGCKLDDCMNSRFCGVQVRGLQHCLVHTNVVSCEQDSS